VPGEAPLPPLVPEPGVMSPGVWVGIPSELLHATRRSEANARDVDLMVDPPKEMRGAYQRDLGWEMATARIARPKRIRFILGRVGFATLAC